MKQDNKQFLDDNYHYYDTLVKAEYMKGLSAQTRQRFQDIIREEWEPQYHTDLWCPPCVANMIKKVYSLYDTWKEQQPDDPRMIILRATFPSNKYDEESKV